MSYTHANHPVTFYQSRAGNREPWIIWASQEFTAAGYSPATRCREVSSRLETYRRNRELNLITVGTMNDQRVICTSSETNGRCENLIFTLRRGADPIATLNNFLAWREGQASTPEMIEGSARQRPVIDVGSRLEAFAFESQAPAATSNPAPAPAPAPAVNPTTPTPQSDGGMREL
ncbi:MAG: COP23 domain-containing protein [Cyanobacteria bacterium SID2]|nr:COP23 domain-containing protein [Cyanobacteria bacterium SID2]